MDENVLMKVYDREFYIPLFEKEKLELIIVTAKMLDCKMIDITKFDEDDELTIAFQQDQDKGKVMYILLKFDKKNVLIRRRIHFRRASRDYRDANFDEMYESLIEYF